MLYFNLVVTFVFDLCKVKVREIRDVIFWLSPTFQKRHQKNHQKFIFGPTDKNEVLLESGRQDLSEYELFGCFLVYFNFPLEYLDKLCCYDAY